MTNYITSFYPESSFGGFTDVDGTVAFYGRVNALLQPSFVVIDFGCGRGAHAEDPVAYRRDLRSLKGKVARVIGIDVDANGAENPTVDEFRPLPPDGRWPVDDHSIGLIVCDSVLEHLSDPQSFFQEAKRALVKGGYLCIRTPNALGYIGLTSRIVPNRLHNRVLSKAQRARKEEDIFPTLYRCNTIGALRRQMNRNGFERLAVYGYEAEPQYLYFSKIAYGIGVLYQRFAPRGLRSAIFAFGQS